MTLMSFSALSWGWWVWVMRKREGSASQGMGRKDESPRAAAVSKGSWSSRCTPVVVTRLTLASRRPLAKGVKVGRSSLFPAATGRAAFSMTPLKAARKKAPGREFIPFPSSSHILSLLNRLTVLAPLVWLAHARPPSPPRRGGYAHEQGCPPCPRFPLLHSGTARDARRLTGKPFHITGHPRNPMLHSRVDAFHGCPYGILRIS